MVLPRRLRVLLVGDGGRLGGLRLNRRLFLLLAGHFGGFGGRLGMRVDLVQIHAREGGHSELEQGVVVRRIQLKHFERFLAAQVLADFEGGLRLAVLVLLVPVLAARDRGHRRGLRVRLVIQIRCLRGFETYLCGVQRLARLPCALLAPRLARQSQVAVLHAQVTIHSFSCLFLYRVGLALAARHQLGLRLTHLQIDFRVGIVATRLVRNLYLYLGDALVGEARRGSMLVLDRFGLLLLRLLKLLAHEVTSMLLLRLSGGLPSLAFARLG